ncbi:MAG: transporter substrate-binding domain-containing protein [Eubacteriales bacterium]|nr:transporter substrate-binding domain-containing protein [Eubacteriales bacterium]
MKNKIRASALFLCLLLLLMSTACGRGGSSYPVLDTLSTEKWNIAFRQGDSVGEIVTAALCELAASGELSRLSSEYLGDDYSCLDGNAGALETLAAETEIPERTLLIGVEANSPPLSLFSGYMFSGFIPALAEKVCETIGWDYQFIPVLPSDASVELASGNVDCVWVSAAFTESSSTAVSPGYLENEEWLIVRRDSGYASKRSLRGLDLAVTDSDNAAAVLKAAEQSDTFRAIWTYATPTECFAALDNKSCSAVLMDSLIAQTIMYG